ncbi:hypothetical protein [Candidatus Uabimicrobium amorphum]|uniref:Uncharacterized protein n=1 Tax=Uabimicrobium amorphum TaxID=2596890 RepID=A0A5S9IJ35_UABAM|nr:hypothetical protein [Candidatus Uabimicrobium amorphum]BBM82312.1 hypothetical protein UABAM_00655 [Candidatus Uabimicrobium amorphum]
MPAICEIIGYMVFVIHLVINYNHGFSDILKYILFFQKTIITTFFLMVLTAIPGFVIAIFSPGDMNVIFKILYTLMSIVMRVGMSACAVILLVFSLIGPAVKCLVSRFDISSQKNFVSFMGWASGVLALITMMTKVSWLWQNPSSRLYRFIFEPIIEAQQVLQNQYVVAAVSTLILLALVLSFTKK